MLTKVRFYVLRVLNFAIRTGTSRTFSRQICCARQKKKPSFECLTLLFEQERPERSQGKSAAPGKKKSRHSPGELCRSNSHAPNRPKETRRSTAKTQATRHARLPRALH